MKYQISQTDPAAMTTEEMVAEFDGFVGLAAEVAERASALLVELRKRKQPHPFFRHVVLAFFDGIADRSLSAEAAIILGNREMIKAVQPLPVKQQVAIASGEPVAVAVLKSDGTIGSDEVPIQRMDAETMKRAFGPTGIRSVYDQGKIMKDQGRCERFGMITVLREETMLKIGNQKVKPEDLRGPLLALGYSLDLTRNTDRKAG